MSGGQRTFWAVFVPGVAVLCLLPFFVTSSYVIRFLTILLFWVGMAGCWNIECGYTGYVDFGPVAYFGIGSYAAALAITRLGLPFFPALIVAGLVAAAVALPIGLTTLRLRGAYFAIATFAFAESMKQVLVEFDQTFHVRLFEGSQGITLPLSGEGSTFFFYCVLAVTAAVVLVHHWIGHSRYGLALRAIHEAEESAEISGVNTTAVKIRAYVISAIFLGVLGGIQAYWIKFIRPGPVFEVYNTVQMVIMTLLGGMGTLLGPVVGAAFLTAISEILGTAFVEYYLIFIGLIIIIVILLMPKGIVGTLKDWKRSTRTQEGRKTFTTETQRTQR